MFYRTINDHLLFFDFVKLKMKILKKFDINGTECALFEVKK